MRSRTCYALLVVLVIAGALAHISRADAEAPPAGAEIRLGARLNDDSTTSIGLQWQEDGRWRGVTPRLSVIPADAEVGQWYASSSVPVPVRRVEAEIRVEDDEWDWWYTQGVLTFAVGDQVWRTECGLLRLRLDENAIRVDTLTNCDDGSSEQVAANMEEYANGSDDHLFRVMARLIADDDIELRMQRLVEGEWRAIEQTPDASLVLSQLGRWKFTDSLAIPLAPAVVSGELRPGATISTEHGRFRAEVDGEVKHSRCGDLTIIAASVSILLRTATEDCSGSEPLFSVCALKNLSQCDRQQYQTYHWEGAHDSHAKIEIDQGDIRRVIEAVYADYISNRSPPALVVSSRLGSSYYRSDKHHVAILPEHRQLDIVLHETAHAIIHELGLETGHGAVFAATIAEILERYAPLVDSRAMRANAERMGVQIADRGPRPMSNDGIEVVRQVICGLGEPGRAMCDAFENRAVVVPAVDLEGRRLGSGSAGNLSWTSEVQDDGSLWTQVTTRSPVEGQPDAVAKLQVVCHGDWMVRLWWPHEGALSGAVAYQSGGAGWIEDHWSLQQGDWENQPPQFLWARDVAEIVHGMIWASSAGHLWIIRVADDERSYDVEFDLSGMFNTPAQADLAACGLHQPASDPNAPILTQGEVNGRLRYLAFVTDGDILLSHVVSESPIAERSGSVALLNIRCFGDDLSVQVWWQIDRNLSSSVQLQFGDHDDVRESWRHHKGTFRIHGVETTLRSQPTNPQALLKELTWASAFGADFTVQARSGGDTYTATFDLEGLFETPVQPNLARCGR